MPIPGNLSDLIFEAISKKLSIPMPEIVAKKAIAGMVDGLTEAGWRILPPGTVAGLPPGGGATREPVKIEPTSYFCPGCGKHKPSYGISMQNAEFLGIGLVGIMTLFCAQDSCRRIHQVMITPPFEQKPKGGQVQ